MLIYNKYFLAIILLSLVSSFLLWIKFSWKGILCLVLAVFLSTISFNSYYKNIGTVKFIVSKVTDYSITGESKGRKYNILSKEKLSEGDIIEGNFKFLKADESDLSIVATIKLEKYVKAKSLKSKIINLKRKTADKLIEEYGYDKGTLMSSLVLGTGSEIFEARRVTMKNLGLMHILSISGFHIMLISNLLSKIKIKKFKFLIIFSYIYFIATIPAYRVLYILIYKKLAKFFKRDPDLITGIFFALFVQSFFRPYLLFNISFILTYFSTLGIIIFQKAIKNFLANFSINKYIIDTVSTTVAALTLSIPFVSLLDSEFSLTILIGSILLVPIYVIVTYISFLATISINIKFFKIVLEPFVKIIFDFSYFLGLFLSQYRWTINFIYLRNYYYYFLILILVFIYKKKPKLIFCTTVIFIFLSLPLASEISVISKFGKPYIRVSQKLRVYDIMDVRINKGYNMINLNSKIKLKIKKNNITILKSENKNEIPKIYFNELRLKIKNPSYKLGEVVIARYIIFGERLIRVE